MNHVQILDAEHKEKIDHPNGWISVKDKLPDTDNYVLWIRENGSIFQECIDKDWDKEYLDYFLSGGKLKEVTGPITHWMPSPESPKI